MTDILRFLTSIDDARPATCQQLQIVLRCFNIYERHRRRERSCLKTDDYVRLHLLERRRSMRIDPFLSPFRRSVENDFE